MLSKDPAPGDDRLSPTARPGRCRVRCAEMPKRGGGGTAFSNLRPGMIIIVKQIGAEQLRAALDPGSRRRLRRRGSPHRPGARDAGRVRRDRLELQSRHPGAAPARLGVQADRLRDRARKRHEPRPRSSSMRRSASGRARACGNKCFRNFDSRYAGPKTMRWGVEQSRNLMTVRAASQTGMAKVIDQRAQARRRRLSQLSVDRARRRRHDRC